MTDSANHVADVAELGPVRAGETLDWERLGAYLSAHVPELGGRFEVEQFPNGSANLTYLLRFPGQDVVLRRPPFGQIAPGAHDMRREYRVLSRLWQHFAPAPRAIHLCTDPDVVGSDFVLMEYRRGEVLWGHLTSSMAPFPDAALRIGRAVVAALADLHNLDPATCGLDDLGRPDGFVARQVEGWSRRWELVAPEGEGEIMTEVAGELRRRLPDPQKASILHNDYKLDNCQFVPGQPDLVHAVFDWDMATVGDPLVDLGTLLNYWPDPTDSHDDRPITPEGLDRMGLPTRREVVDLYAERTGLNLADVSWYEAFACFKTAVVLQQLYARWVRGETTDRRMAERGAWVGPMSRRAARILKGDTRR